MVLLDSHRVPRVPWYSGFYPGRLFRFNYGAITLCGRPFQVLHLQNSFVTSRGLRDDLRQNPTTPSMQHTRAIRILGLGSSHFARRYFGNRNFFLFLRVLRCFTSPRSLPLDYVFIKGIPRHYPGWVTPFGHPRIKACLAAPRGFSQLTTSFIASWRQGIHHLPLVA